MSYLVDTLEGGNAKRFCEKTNILPQSVSSVRHGKYKINRFIKRITDAYPDVNLKWLQTGEGEPLRSVPEKGVVLEKIERLEKEVKRLSKLIDKMAKSITKVSPE